MMSGGTLKIVTFVLLAIAFKPLVVTSMTTSYEKLRTLVAKGDLQVMEGIQKQIKEDLGIVNNLTMLLKEFTQVKVRHVNFTAEHPNDLYLLVKHHIQTWYSASFDRDLFASLEKHIDNRNVIFPKEKDIDDAGRALIQLQSVYRLKARDMFEGNYLGHRGSPLTLEDAYRLGRNAFDEGKLQESIEWLLMVASMQTKARAKQAQKAPTDAQQTSSEVDQSERIHVETLALLGRAFLYANDTTKASGLLEKCLASGRVDVTEVDKLREELQTKDLHRLRKDDVRDKDTEENITVLCSRDKEHRVSALHPHHLCRYKVNVFIPYQRFEEEILSTSPYVSVFYDVIYDAETERIKSLAKEQSMSPPKVKSKTFQQMKSNEQSWELFSDKWHKDPLVTRVSQRVMAFTRLNPTQSETIKVMTFGIGGRYDFLPRGPTDIMAIVQFYLSDIKKGGTSIFPRLGISVFPVKGSVLLWYKYPPHVNYEHKNYLQVECPVLSGNKWIARRPMLIGDNAFHRPCGSSVESKQLDVENIVSVDTLKY